MVIDYQVSKMESLQRKSLYGHVETLQLSDLEDDRVSLFFVQNHDSFVVLFDRATYPVMAGHTIRIGSESELQAPIKVSGRKQRKLLRM
jgi:hypothetical protein